MKIEVIGLLILGLASLIVAIKEVIRFTPLILLLLFTVVGMAILPILDKNGGVIIGMSIGAVALNYLASYVKLFQKQWMVSVVPLISAIILLSLFGDDIVEVEGNATAAVNKFVVIGSVLASFPVLLGTVKRIALTKIGLEVEDIDLMLAIVVGGSAIFFGTFGAPVVGTFLVSAIYLSATFYSTHNQRDLMPLILTVNLIPFLFSNSLASGADLYQADTLLGLMLGVFGGLLIARSVSAAKSKTFLAGFSWVLTIAIGLILLLQEQIYISMGGMDAFVAYLIGLTIVHFLLNGQALTLAVVAVLFSVGVYTSSISEEEQTEEISTQKIEDSKEVVNEVLLPLSEVLGKYEIEPEQSRVDFNIGDKDVTKGAFKKVYGNVDVAEDVLSTSLTVELKLEDFTTFNKFRDESLHSAEYFDADKYPVMTFDIKNLQNTAVENEYTAVGQFTMLGKTNPVEVTLKRVAQDEGWVLKGTGEIDRTKFGMTPSITEGNVARFEYQVVMKRK